MNLAARLVEQGHVRGFLRERVLKQKDALVFGHGFNQVCRHQLIEQGTEIHIVSKAAIPRTRLCACAAGTKPPYTGIRSDAVSRLFAKAKNSRARMPDYGPA
jgi:hypothetical protein